MRVSKEDMRLYVVTDRGWLGEKTLTGEVDKILRSGATFLQLREKKLDFDAFVAEAREIGRVAAQYGVPFLINDNLDVAVAAHADGVHIGQEDMPAHEARARLGADKIVGVSAGTVAQAVQAEQDGADYLGVGAVFSTSTKRDANTVSLETLRAICSAVSIPVVAIGGIHDGNIMQLKGSGADGVAVISAIFAQPDVCVPTKRLRFLADEMVQP